MKYSEWEMNVPAVFTDDALWKMTVYRYALFAADMSWLDVSKLAQDKRTIRLADQLYRAVGSIGANIAEGYSRSTGPDRVRFYAYALGSAREARGWTYQARHILGEAVTAHRLDLLAQIIRLLLTMIPKQRHRTFKEENHLYTTNDTPNESN